MNAKQSLKIRQARLSVYAFTKVNKDPAVYMNRKQKKDANLDKMVTIRWGTNR